MGIRKYVTLYDGDDCIFKGYLLDGKKDGYGEEFTYIDVEYQDVYDKWQTSREISTVYKGDFKNDLRHGEGIYKSYSYHGSGLGSLDTKASRVKDGRWSYDNFNGRTKTLDEYHSETRYDDYPYRD